jgi:hypothetical protein
MGLTELAPAITYPFALKYVHRFAERAAPVIGLLCIFKSASETVTLDVPIGGVRTSSFGPPPPYS